MLERPTCMLVQRRTFVVSEGTGVDGPLKAGGLGVIGGLYKSAPIHGLNSGRLRDYGSKLRTAWCNDVSPQIYAAVIDSLHLHSTDKSIRRAKAPKRRTWSDIVAAPQQWAMEAAQCG
jgi:hypothetical protein